MNEEIVLLKKQLKATRIVAAACTVCLAVIIVCAALIVPSMASAAEKLDKVASELAETDYSAMVQNVNDLVLQSQSAVTEAAQKIESIDIETLNKAIQDFSNVVGPLAALFG